MREIESYCRNCGEEIKQKIKQKLKRFCSDKCRYDHWNIHREEVGRKALNTAVCKYCGNEFKSYEIKKRKYCCHACYIADRFGRGKPLRQQNREASQKRRDWALAKYHKGSSCGTIAKETDISINTVKSWVRRYAKRREAREIGYNAQNYLYKKASSSDDWIDILRAHEKGADYESKGYDCGSENVHLVSGTLNEDKGADQLCAIIQVRLKMNQVSGDVFVFCGKSRDLIRYIRWDGIGFEIVSRRREWGRYVWPSSELGLVVTHFKQLEEKNRKNNTESTETKKKIGK